MGVSKYYASYEEVLELADSLANEIKADGKEYDWIVPLANGGMSVAAILYDRLRDHVKNGVAVMHLTRYEGKEGKELKLKYLPDISGKVLIVDDLVDHGDTLKAAHTLFPEADTAALYVKEGAAFEPTYAARYIPRVWVVFPWEKD